MALADSYSIQEFGFVKPKIGERAEKYVGRAVLQMKAWISAEVYDGLSAESDAGKVATQAESLLALAFALPALNLRFTELGGLSKIIGIPGETSEELMSFVQVKQYQEELKKQAFQLIESLVPELEAEPESFSTAGFSIMASTNFANPEGL